MARLLLFNASLFVLLTLVASSPTMAQRTSAEEDEANEPEDVPLNAKEIAGVPDVETDWVDPGDVKSLRLLIRYLGENNEVVQDMSLYTLSGMGPKARPAVPAILKTLMDPKCKIRVAAARTLFDLNCRTEEALHALTEELKSADPSNRALAARAIGNLVDPPYDPGSCWGPEPPPCIPRPSVGKRALPALIEALSDKESQVRAGAAFALGAVGRNAKSAVPKLRLALFDSDPAVSKTAAEALQKIASPPGAKAALR